MSKFNRLASSIERREGIGKERARAITAAIGRKKYGRKGMARKAAAGRRRAARRRRKA